MATKKKVPEKKVEKKKSVLVVNRGNSETERTDSLEEYFMSLIVDRWDTDDINESFSFFIIIDGEICEITDLAIDISEVVPIITYKVGNKEN